MVWQPTHSATPGAPWTASATSAVAITSTIALSDLDDTNIESAVVAITANYVNGQDVLSFVNTANITGSWDAGSGTLTLSGTDTVANYQAALRSVTFAVPIRLLGA